MIYGICTNMNARSPNDLGIDQAPYAKKLGLDYLELSVDRIMRYDDERFECFKKELAQGPLPCLACNNFIDGSIKLAGKEFNKDAFENYIKKALARIAAIGAKKVVFGSSRARNIPSYLSHEEGRAQVIERLIYIAQAAETHSLDIVIEHLNRSESNVFNTFDETVSLAKELKRPNIKSIFDSYHFGVSFEDEELIQKNGAWIGHIHFACITDRKMPDLEDAKKMSSLFKILRESSYDETFSLEAYFPNTEMDNIYYKTVMDYIKGELG